ncbi:MAG: hypothetical protein PHI96_07900 [Desulfovibrio sp.]|nr:hypothetical protein [Desulfovibrio sp.]
MQEFYDLKIEGTKLHFIPRADGAEGFEFALPEPPENHSATGILGDPELMYCVAFRREDGPGGVFAMYDESSLLFVAVAGSNLAYSLGLAQMGRMVTYSRYGADIFDALDENDD